MHWPTNNVTKSRQIRRDATLVHSKYVVLVIVGFAENTWCKCNRDGNVIVLQWTNKDWSHRNVMMSSLMSWWFSSFSANRRLQQLFENVGTRSTSNVRQICLLQPNGDGSHPLQMGVNSRPVNTSRAVNRVFLKWPSILTDQCGRRIYVKQTTLVPVYWCPVNQTI